MKLISSAICVLITMGVVQSTFPNDLYYHHHPDQLVKSNNKNQLHNNYAKPHRYEQGGYRNHNDHPYRANYHHGSHANYHEGGRHRSNYHDGTRHRFEPRSNTEEPSIYNEDGSINWKFKASQQDDYESNRRPYRRPYEDEYIRGRYNGRPRNFYDDYYDDDEYYEDDYQENYGQDESYYGDYQRGGQSSNHKQSSGSNYGQSSGSSYDEGYSYDSGSSYDEGYGGSNYDQQQQHRDQQNGNTQPVSQKDSATRYGASGAGFAGGLRLAGELPQDGYTRGLGTFYDLETHVGMCGKQHKNTEHVVSVNLEQMGDNCGKEIEVVGPNGKTIKVVVVDSCKTCKSGGLDLSPAAYEQLGDFSHGSVPIKWKFT